MNFKQRVINFIKNIPTGKVVSYGQVAGICGKPRGAREVGWILRNLDASTEDISWWRVINHKGEVSIKGNWTASKELQVALLKREGVKVDKNLKIDMKKYRNG